MRITCLDDARRRVTAGRVIALSAAAVYCLLRVFMLMSGNLTPAGKIITADGALTWPWAAAWLTAAGWCVWDIIQHRTRHGLAFTVALAMTWGTGNVGVWAMDGFTGTGWASALGYYAPALIVFGLMLKIGALYDLLEDVSNHLRAQQGTPDE
jgi:hypothetical protein